jgi:hypothetical protein
MTFDSVPLHTFRWTSDAVWRSVVDAVARVSRVDPLDLPPLAEAIEPTSIDALLQHAGSNDGRRRSTLLCFPFAGYRVLLSSAGRGYLYAPT